MHALISRTVKKQALGCFFCFIENQETYFCGPLEDQGYLVRLEMQSIFKPDANPKGTAFGNTKRKVHGYIRNGDRFLKRAMAEKNPEKASPPLRLGGKPLA